ncbi:unnamed protein product, partial [Ectocarpus sp. 13 AM-2016]
GGRYSGAPRHVALHQGAHGVDTPGAVRGATSGRGLIHQDLLAQVITPALLHAGDNVGALPVDEIGTQESVVYKCLRKARASGRLSNGGLGPTNARSF